MNIQIIKSIRLYIPFLSGYFMTAVCPIIDTTDFKSKPEPIVFAIVWPILYFLLGYSWVILQNYEYTDTLFGLNIVLGALWIYNYSCIKRKKNALYVLLAMILASIYLILYCFEKQPYITYLIAPYTVWLLFAIMLNFKAVNMS